MCSASMSRKSQAPKDSSRVDSTRMTEMLFQRFQAGGVIPKLLQNAVQSSGKLSSVQLKTETVKPDGIVLEKVQLGVRNRRPDDQGRRSADPAAVEDQRWTSSDASDEQLLFADNIYWKEFMVKDKRWRDNRLSMGDGFPLQKLAVIAAGPGGPYQLMYRIYCSLATLSLVLFVSCLLAFTAIAVLVVPICGRARSDGPGTRVAQKQPAEQPLNSAPPSMPAKSRRQTVFVLGIVASACGMGSILLIFAAMLVKAWSVYQFGCLQLPESKPSGSGEKSPDLTGELTGADIDTFSEAGWN